MARSGELDAKTLITAVSVLLEGEFIISRQFFARALINPSDEFSRFLRAGFPVGPIDVMVIIPRVLVSMVGDFISSSAFAISDSVNDPLDFRESQLFKSSGFKENPDFERNAKSTSNMSSFDWANIEEVQVIKTNDSVIAIFMLVNPFNF